MTFRDKLVHHVEAFRPYVEILDEQINPPVTQDEIDRVHAQLGFALADAFLAYFRAANGWKIRWKAIDETTGTFWVRPLAQLFAAERSGVLCGAGSGPTPYLGGMDEGDLWSGLRLLGSATDVSPDARDILAIYADARRTDPVVLRVSDYGASATDARPMLARDAFELSAIYLDTFPLVDDGWLENAGFAGDHAVVPLDLTGLPVEPLIPYDRDDGRNDYALALIQHLRGKAGLMRASPTAAPVRSYRARYVAPKDRLDAVRTAAKGHPQLSQTDDGTFTLGDSVKLDLRTRGDDTLAMLTYTTAAPAALIADLRATLERVGLTIET